MLTFTPRLQRDVAEHVERAYTGEAPSLGRIKNCYGRDVVIALLCSYLENLNDFTGVKQKIELDQQKEVATIFLTEYYYLKITEVLLFFYRLKTARYGHFFGVVDGMFITGAIYPFLEERRAALLQYEKEKRDREIREERERRSTESVTYQEYLEQKKQLKKLGMKSYSFQELALEYFPDRTAAAAAKQLNSWINNIPDLEDKLIAAGRYKNQKIMTPLQVSIITHELGEPDKWVKERERIARENALQEKSKKENK